MKRRTFERTNSKDVVRAIIPEKKGICVSIPIQKTEYGDEDTQLIQSSSLNLVMHKFISQLIEINFAEKSLLQDIEFIIDDYLLRFQQNDDLDYYDEDLLNDDYLY